MEMERRGQPVRSRDEGQPRSSLGLLDQQPLMHTFAVQKLSNYNVQSTNIWGQIEGNGI